MDRHWLIESGDYTSAARARRDFATHLQRAAGPHSDCQAAILIFGELVANALTHGRGSVHAYVGPGSPHAILWVEDDGDGFSLEHVQQPTRGQLGGRGILIARSLSHSLSVGRAANQRFRVTVELPVQLIPRELPLR